MISRKRILSNSCTHLSSEGSGGPSKGCSFDEDVWFDKDSLYRDHIQEILNKYNQLDDEIWGKIICMERNRRVAKAYARSPVITIDNGSIGFDGDSIGLRGFENPYRDTEILVTHKSISSGLAIGADEAGNILIQLIEQRNLYMRELNSSCADESIIKKNGKLKPGCVYKIFCMKKFLNKLNQLQCNSSSSNSNGNNGNSNTSSNGTSGRRNGKGNSSGSNLNKSSNRRSNNISTTNKQHNRRHSNPDEEDDEDEDEISRVSLENQCFSIISLSSHADGQLEPLLDTAVWIIVINIIALEMLHRNLNLIPNSSSSDLASSWSCSSCSTSCSDVERMDKSYSLNHHHHKSTGNLRDIKESSKSNGHSNNSSNNSSKCTRCRGLNEINVSSSHKCQSSNGNNSSKVKSLAVSKSNGGGHHRGHQIKSDHEVSTVSERLGKLFIPFNEDEDESTTTQLTVVNGKSSSSAINCNGGSKIENLNSLRHSSWQGTPGGPGPGTGSGGNNNFQSNEQVTEIDSSFSLSHSSSSTSSTSNSSSDIVKCNTLTHTGHSGKLNKSNGNKVRKGGQFHHQLQHQHQHQPHHHHHHLHHHHQHSHHTTSPGEFSSGSSSGYAVSSETTSSTTTNGPTTTTTMSMSSNSNGNGGNGRSVKRNIEDHFAGHFDKQIDQQCNSKTKCLVNCDTNKGENCNCKGNCGTNKVTAGVNSLSLGGNLTSMSKKAKSQVKKSQFNSNTNGNSNNNNNSHNNSNGNNNTKSSNLSNNGHDFTFDEGHNDSYNTSSSSSASGGNFNDNSNGGQGAGSKLSHKVKSSKITSTGNNRLNNNSNNSSTCPATTTTTTTKVTSTGSNLATHALANVENQLTKSTNDSKVLTLGTHSQCNLPLVPSGKNHCPGKVNQHHHTHHHRNHHEQQQHEQHHQVSMSCKSSKSSKLNSPQGVNNGDHSKSNCIGDEWDSAIPTPDYDDSGNENYGFIGARSGFGGHRLRLCTSNLLLSENCYHCSNNLPSSCSEFYTESQFNPRLSQSTNYLSSDHGDRDRDQEEEDEIYTTTAMINNTNSNSGFLNSVLRHLPLSTITSKQRKSGKYSLNYQTSWKRLSFPGIFSSSIGHNESLTPSMSSAGDSDNSYTHIYSSICDSAVGTSTTTTSSNFYGRSNSKNGPRNDFRAKQPNHNNNNNSNNKGNSKSSNNNNNNNGFYTDCSCNSIKDENGYCYKSNCRYLNNSKNGIHGTISYSSTNGINGNNLCNGFIALDQNSKKGNSVKSKSTSRQGNFASIKCATLSMPAISFGHGNGNNTIKSNSKNNRHMSFDGKTDDDSFGLARRPLTPSDHPGHHKSSGVNCKVKPLSRSSDFAMDCPYVTFPFDSSIGDIDTDPSVSKRGPSLMMPTVPIGGPNCTSASSGINKGTSSKGSTLGAKLARKGSKGLKRATSIPKTLKLFIKRNGKRSVSE